MARDGRACKEEQAMAAASASSAQRRESAELLHPQSHGAVQRLCVGVRCSTASCMHV
jgi:hypothetical protein